MSKHDDAFIRRPEALPTTLRMRNLVFEGLRTAARLGNSMSLPRWTLLLLFGTLVLLPELASMPARDSTDARYLEAGREMCESADYLVPTLAGAPHLEKPPLAYWSACLGYRLWGTNVFGGRFVQQLFLLATAGVLFFQAGRFGGRPGSLLAPGLFLTSALVFGASRGLSTDLFQLFFLTAALGLLFEGTLDRGRPRCVAAALALLGASMLAKGPVALLVAAVVLGPYLLLTRGRTTLPKSGLATGVLAFALLGLPWFAFLVYREPSLLHHFVLDELVGRVTGGNLGHEEGPAYLLVRWPVALLPWTPLVGLALWRLWPHGAWRRADPRDVFLVLWATLPVLLFSLFATKLSSYLLPALPGAALAVARAAHRGLLDDVPGRRATTLAAVITATAACVALGVGLQQGSRGQVPGPSWIPAFLTLLAAGALFVGLGPMGARRFATRTTALVLVTGATLALGAGWVTPAAPSLWREGRIVSSVPEARLVQLRTFRPSVLFYSGAWRHSYVAGVAWFCQRPLPGPHAETVCLSGRKTRALLAEDVPTFVLVAEENRPDIAGSARTWEVDRQGGLVLLANEAARRALPETLAARAP